DCGFAENVNEADLARAVDVGAPAELHAEGRAFVTDLDDADIAPVLVAEEGEGARIDGGAVAGRAPMHLEVVADLIVGELLDLLEDGTGRLLEVSEVEA